MWVVDDAAGHGGDEDDAAVGEDELPGVGWSVKSGDDRNSRGSGDHVSTDGAGDAEGADQVDVDGLGEVGDGIAFGFNVGEGDAGGIDQNVDVAEVLCYLGDCIFNSILIGDVNVVVFYRDAGAVGEICGHSFTEGRLDIEDGDGLNTRFAESLSHTRAETSGASAVALHQQA